jgi:hypothetical protein
MIDGLRVIHPCVTSIVKVPFRTDTSNQTYLGQSRFLNDVVFFFNIMPTLCPLVSKVDDRLIDVQYFPSLIEVLNELTCCILSLLLRTKNIGSRLEEVSFLIPQLEFLLQIFADSWSCYFDPSQLL